VLGREIIAVYSEIFKGTKMCCVVRMYSFLMLKPVIQEVNTEFEMVECFFDS